MGRVVRKRVGHVLLVLLFDLTSGRHGVRNRRLAVLSLRECCWDGGHRRMREGSGGSLIRLIRENRWWDVLIGGMNGQLWAGRAKTRKIRTLWTVSVGVGEVGRLRSVRR